MQVETASALSDSRQELAQSSEQKMPKSYTVPHSEVRSKICFFCQEKSSRTIFTVKKCMPALQDLSQHIDFSAVNVPVGICEKCRRSSWLADIFNNEKQITRKQLKKQSFEFVEPDLKSDVCHCYLCKKYRELFPQRTRNLVKKVEKKIQKVEKNPFVDKCICFPCGKLFKISNTRPHICPKEVSRKTKFENTTALLENSPKMAQFVISHFLKNFQPSPDTHRIRLQQFQGGQPLTISLGQPQKIPPKVQLDADDLIEFEMQNNKSNYGNNSSFRLGTFLNKKIGRGTMTKGFQRDYFEKTHILSNFSEGQYLSCFAENKKKKIRKWEDKPAALVKDVSEFVLKIMEELDWNPQDCTIQYSVDRGDSQLKFSVRILHNLYGDLEDFEATGDFLVGIVYGAEENYENVKTIEDKISIHSICML